MLCCPGCGGCIVYDLADPGSQARLIADPPRCRSCREPMVWLDHADPDDHPEVATLAGGRWMRPDGQPAHRCLDCRRTADVPSMLGHVSVCAAFPRGIPAAIWRGEADHVDPVPGDGGLTYARMSPAEFRAYWRREPPDGYRG